MMKLSDAWLKFISGWRRNFTPSELKMFVEQLRAIRADEVAALEAELEEARDTDLWKSWQKSQTENARLREELATVLDVAIARGKELGYDDEDYEIWLAALQEEQE